MDNAITLRPEKNTTGSGVSLFIALIAVVSVYVLIVGANMARMHS